MSGVFAQIPMSTNTQMQIGPDPQKMMAIQQDAMQLQQQKDVAARTNALNDILKKPGAVDPATGQPTTNAMKEILAINPQAGMALMQAGVNQSVQLQGMQDKQFAQKSKLLSAATKEAMEIGRTSLSLYDQAIHDGHSPDEAQQQAQAYYTDQLDAFQASGVAGPDFHSQMSPKFDPARARANLSWQEKNAELRTADAEARAAKPPKTPAETMASDKARDIETLTSEQVADEEAKQGYPVSPAQRAQIRRDVTNRDAAASAGGVAQAKEGVKKAAAVLSPDAADFSARTYLRTGQMPGGTRNQYMIDQVLEEATKLAKADVDADHPNGHDVNDYIEGRATLKADTASLGKVTAIRNAAEGYEKGTIAALDKMVTMIPKTPEPLHMPFFTKWARTGSTATGGTDVLPYEAQLITALDQYAKVLSGSTGAQASTDSARNLALSLIPPGTTADQIPAIVDTLKADMGLKIKGYNEEVDAIKKDVHGTPPGVQTHGPDKPTAPTGPVPMRGGDDLAAAKAAHPNAIQAPDGRVGVPGPNNTFIPLMRSGTQPAPPTAPAAGTQPAAPSAPAASAAPTAYPVPPGHEGDPDGRVFNASDGSKWMKRGNQLVPAATYNAPAA
jgi:hypothetical protein